MGYLTVPKTLEPPGSHAHMESHEPGASEPSGSHAPRTPEQGDSEDWPDLAIIPGLQKWRALGSGRITF
jgi:hypothetical protein